MRKREFTTEDTEGTEKDGVSEEARWSARC